MNNFISSFLFHIKVKQSFQALISPGEPIRTNRHARFFCGGDIVYHSSHTLNKCLISGTSKIDPLPPIPFKSRVPQGAASVRQKLFADGSFAVALIFNAATHSMLRASFSSCELFKATVTITGHGKTDHTHLLPLTS
jgi:hypothetical protein